MVILDTIEFPLDYTAFWDESENEWVPENAFLAIFGGWTSIKEECRKSFLFRNSTLLENDVSGYGGIGFNDDLIKVHVEMNFTDGWMEIVELEFISQYYSGAEVYESASKFLGVIDYASNLKVQLLRQYELIKSGEDYYGDSEMMWSGENER